jgi:hypothetical protein
MNLNSQQIKALNCAILDLIGALEAQRRCDTYHHDCESHLQSITELRIAFPEWLGHISIENLLNDEV